ncbi:MAG TPA: DUF3224 domain-containing protein, partial [Microlunatus sp.]|nr:DUF3224 domain-containing protein [Microlunatus sp.]
MHARGTFTVSDWTERDWQPPIETAASVGQATMIKTFTGEITGRAATLFVGALNTDSGAGSYVAMEAFEGSIAGRSGTINFLHTASTRGSDRYDEKLAIVPDSGTADLAGVTGTGA